MSKCKRVNITVDEDILHDMDVMANYYSMNRSEYIQLMHKIIQEWDAWTKLENVAIDCFFIRGTVPSAYDLERAARRCHVEKGRDL